jgi:hypothetical protein
MINRELHFKKQLNDKFIPHIKRMLEKEKEHLEFLKKHKAPNYMISYSEDMINHLEAREQEYIEYEKTL